MTTTEFPGENGSWDSKYKWGIFLTIISVILCLVLLYAYRKSLSASDVGQLIGGFSAQIAFIWIILSYVVQTKALSIQMTAIRQEIGVLSIATEQARRTNYYQDVDGFVRVHDFVHAAIREDVLSICRSLSYNIRDHSTGVPPALSSLIEMMLGDEQLESRILEKLRLESSLNLSSLLLSFLNKYDLLLAHAAKISELQDLFLVTIESSPLAHLQVHIRAAVHKHPDTLGVS